MRASCRPTLAPMAKMVIESRSKNPTLAEIAQAARENAHLGEVSEADVAAAAAARGVEVKDGRISARELGAIYFALVEQKRAGT